MKFFLPILLFSLIKNTFTLDTADCGTNYGCFKIPSDCKSVSCDYIVKWRDNGTNTDFIMQAKPMESNFYLAIGFSYDRKMGEDCVVMCKYNNEGKSTIEHYYNPRKEKDTEVLDPDNRSIGLAKSTVTLDENFLTCSFKRSKSIENIEKYFDLNEMYYLLLVKGYLDPDNEPINHKKNKFASHNEINFSVTTKEENFSNFNYTKVHAILMITAWMIFATFGIIFARYFKFLKWNWCSSDSDLWFNVHRSHMTLVPILTLIGFGIILYSKDFQLIQPGLNSNFFHSVLGLLTIAFSIIQPFYGMLRPSKNTHNRKYFNWIHRIFGFLTIISAIASIVVGCFIFFNGKKWIIFAAWIGWLAFVIILLELVEYKLKTVKDEPLIESEKEENRSYHSTFNQQFKLFLLILHVLASLLMVCLMNFFVIIY